MGKLTVAHMIHDWLPVTQNWVYNQLVFNTESTHLVVSLFIRPDHRFPFDRVYASCSGTGLNSRCKLLLSRFWLWQPHAFFRSVIVQEKPQIIHGHFSTESWRIFNVAQSLCLPLVTTFYGLDVNKLPRRHFWKKRYPILFQYGNAFVVEGPYMGKRLVELGCPSEKVQVIHIGVDIEKVRLYRDTGKKGADQPVRILFTGLEREKKGASDAAEVFCRAARETPHIELHLIGDGPFRVPVMEILKKHGCESKARFHGYIEVQRYLQLLNKSDIVLAPSCTARDGDTEGGAPVVCIEAQAAEKPVVGTLHCDIPEIVRHGESGLLCQEHDLDSLTSNLLKLIRDRQLRERMGKKGYEHVLRQHDIRKQARVLQRLYCSVLDHHNSGVV